MANNGKEFITNFRNSRLNPFSPSSPASLITRGDAQKAKRINGESPFVTRFRTARTSEEHPEDPSQDNPDNTAYNNPIVPKAPSFRYKNPATDNDVAYWKGFTDSGTMEHYDDLMNILENVEEMGTVDDIRKYISGIKDTTMYKVLPGVQAWTNDLESLYYDLDEKYDLSYPVDLMRYQTTKARSAFENGYRNNLYTQEHPRIPSPSELLPRIKNSFK